MVPAPRDGLGSAEASRTMTSEEYQAAIAVAKEYITAGDIFQVVLSQRFDLQLDADPFDVYRALRLLNPSPYLYFLRFPEVTVVGASPEPMVRLREGIVTSRPIAGSRPRGENEHHDRLLEGELAEDPKELAEHIMLVDLARNDVGPGGPLRHREGRRADDDRALQPHHAHHLAGLGRAGRGQGADRRAAGHPAGRDAVGRAQGAGHGDHRRARADQARRVRGRGGLHRLLGQHRHRHRHPDHGGLARRAGPRAGRGGDRGRQRPRARGRGVRPEGAGAAGGGDGGPGHDERPAGAAASGRTSERPT